MLFSPRRCQKGGPKNPRLGQKLSQTNFFCNLNFFLLSSFHFDPAIGLVSLFPFFLSWFAFLYLSSTSLEVSISLSHVFLFSQLSVVCWFSAAFAENFHLCTLFFPPNIQLSSFCCAHPQSQSQYLSLSHSLVFFIFHFLILSVSHSLILSFSHTRIFCHSLILSLSLSHSLSFCFPIFYPSFLSMSVSVFFKSVFSFHKTKIRMMKSVLLYFLVVSQLHFLEKVCHSIDTLFFQMGQTVKNWGGCVQGFVDTFLM